VLKKIEAGEVQCIARDLPEPSPMAHEILNVKPYAFLDNAPLEERRTQAVYTRRASESSGADGLGVLDGAAIQSVCADAWPRATNPDELHDALLLSGVMTEEELKAIAPQAVDWLGALASERRAGRLLKPPRFWIAAERLALVRSVYHDADTEPSLTAPESADRSWEPEDALRELVRGRMEISGPVTASALTILFQVSPSQVEGALLALEAEGFVLRGKFRPGAQELEWCDRRLLARIHRLTLNRLRAEIQPVSIAEFQRFLLA
jgi:ATP-dependent Lhr-like helicase